MYFRNSIRRYKDREYHSVQLVERHRHVETRRPTTKVVASLGDLTELLCNRLDDPRSKLGVLEWLQTVVIPGIDPDGITYQGLLRTMDVLIEHKDEIERRLADRVRTLFDTELHLVPVEVTSVSVTTRHSEHPLFEHGYGRDGHPERKQYVLMMVTTKDGVPVYHDVHPGSTANVTLVDATMKRARQLFSGVDRCMVVADRGMLSQGNLEALAKLGFEHLVALPLKRATSTRELIESTHDELMQKARDEGGVRDEGERAPEVVIEAPADDGRYVVPFSMDVARTNRAGRERKLDEFDEKAAFVEARLQGKVPSRGRQLTDQGAFKQLIKEAL